MSTDNLIAKLQNSPEFKQLIRKRLRVCVILSVIMIAFFSCYFLCMAYLPEFMGRSLFDSSVISIGVYFSIALMLLGVLLSGFYSWWSSNKIDPMKDKLIKEFLDEKE